MRLSVDYRKHFTMIRAFHLADFFTLANAACGVAAIFCAMTYVDRQSLTHFFTATALVPAALISDMLDGRVARWRHTHSAWARTRFTRRHHIVRGRAGSNWIRRRVALRLGLGSAYLFRLLRRKPVGPVQRHR